MYKIGDAGGLFLSLPPTMQTPENNAFSFAVERQVKRMALLAQKLNVWSDLDHADSKHYDYMAACLRVLYYRSDMTEEQKKDILKSSMLTYRYAGSVHAIEELLGNLFREAEFVPWYAYGGRPYHFKITVNGDPDAETKKVLQEVLRKVKAARSVIDAVEISERRIQTQCYIGIGMMVTDTTRIRCMDLPAGRKEST